MKDDYTSLLDSLNESPGFRQEFDTTSREFEVGVPLALAREFRKLTQAELSNIVNISQGDISDIETGKANPTLSTLERLAAGLQMKLKISLTPCDLPKEK